MLIISILCFLAYLGNTSGILQVSPIQKAVAVLSGPFVTGTVYFTQELPGGPVTISGDLKNVTPNAERGFHVHDFGDATNGCLSMGGHYNPLNRTHGAPSDFERHVGDLGNVQSDANGIVTLNISDNQISLNGPFSIIGRSIVIHLGTDDLGRGNNTESLLNGNSGPRAGCGVIGIAAT